MLNRPGEVEEVDSDRAGLAEKRRAAARRAAISLRL
jgi:hypothetical protein